MDALTKPKAERVLTEAERETYNRALHGDETAITSVRKMLRDEPTLALRFGGDAADAAINLLLQIAWKKYPTVIEAMSATIRQLRVDLAGPNPSGLEQLLVDRIAACWLQMAHADTLYAGNLETANNRTIEHLEERRDRAHRRYLSAIKALAQVRRLPLSMVQVNVAGQQVVRNGAK